MARIIKNSNFDSQSKKVNDLNAQSQSVVDQYNSQAFQQYSQFLNEIPVFVNYYQKDHFESLADKNLNQIHEVMGRNSPVIFNKLENFPLYKTTRISLDVSGGTQGDEAIAEFQAIVLPDTIKPMVDDLLTIWYENEQNVFRVNDVQRSKIEGKQFYQIKAYLYKRDKDLNKLAEQTSKSFVVSKDGKSVEGVDLIEKNSFDKVSDLEEMNSQLFNYYKEFYDQRINQFTFKVRDPQGQPTDNNVWDWNLNNFCHKFQIFTDRRKFRNEIFISNVDLYKRGEVAAYKESLFFRLENKIATNLNFDQIQFYQESELLQMDFQKNVFKTYDKKTIRIRPCLHQTVQTSSYLIGLNDYPMFYPSHVKVVDNLHQYLIGGQELTIGQSVEYYLNVVDEYIKGTLQVDHLVEHFQKIQFNATIADYYFIPMIMYIIQDIIGTIKTAGFYEYKKPDKLINTFAEIIVHNVNTPQYSSILEIPTIIKNIVLDHPVSFTQVDTDGTFSVSNKAFGGFPQIDDIKKVHLKDQLVWLTIGTGLSNLDTPEEADKFYKSLLKIISDYGIDGINISIKDQSLKGSELIDPRIDNTNKSLNILIESVNKLTEFFPHLRIMMTQTIKQLQAVNELKYNENEYGINIPLYEQLKNKLSFVNCKFIADDQIDVKIINKGIEYTVLSDTNKFNLEQIKLLATGQMMKESVGDFFRLQSVPVEKLCLQVTSDPSDANLLDASELKDFINLLYINDIKLSNFMEVINTIKPNDDFQLQVKAIETMKQINQ